MSRADAIVYALSGRLDGALAACFTDAVNAPRQSSIDAVASQLRTLSSAAAEGTLLGSEDSLVAELRASRVTIRQAARMLEHEGFLCVRRGPSGGYFAARPNLSTVEATVSSYLDTISINVDDFVSVATSLWIEAMRRAASERTAEAKETAQWLRERVLAVSPNASFNRLSEAEKEYRAAIFGLIRGRYIELIFQINFAYAARHVGGQTDARDSPAPPDFLRDWRTAKLMECDAIERGDPEFGMLAARVSRNLWNELRGQWHGE